MKNKIPFHISLINFSSGRCGRANVLTWLFDFIRNDTADKMRLCWSQIGHETTEWFTVKCRDSLEGTTLLSFTLTSRFLCGFSSIISWDISGPNISENVHGRLFEETNDGTVQRILVLGQPISDVITNSTSVMIKFEMWIWDTFFLLWFWFADLNGDYMLYSRGNCWGLSKNWNLPCRSCPNAVA